MFVKMKPVCDCGYIFEKLDINYEYIECFNTNNTNMPISHISAISSYIYDPVVCPNCGMKIEGLVYKIPNDGGFHYDDSEFSEG